MNKHSQLIAHLQSLSPLKKGDNVEPNQIIGIRGNTGASEGKHVHIQDCLDFQYEPFHSWDFESGEVIATPEQTFLSITGGYSDFGLFGCEPKIESPFHSYAYFKSQKKHHWGYDVNPKDPRFNNIHWNRSFNAIVLDTGIDPGFGFYIILGYKVG